MAAAHVISSVAAGRGDEVYVAAAPLRGSKGPPQFLLSAAFSLGVWDLRHLMLIVKPSSSSPPPHSQFDVVDADPSDHCYFMNKSFCTKCETYSVIRNNYTTKTKFDAIMRERKQLEQCMPDSIYIRAYKCEISLLCAAIVGLPGTPYHNFLFLFDICLPNNYPSIPPKIHCQGFKVAGIHPNLGSGAEIILSSIKDGSGKRSNRWNPNSSTLLQQLLAIQALVFVEKPYYNKCLHVPFAGKNTRERWAGEYNDKVLQRCCVLTTNIPKRPPKFFGDLVATHFRQRGLDILTTFVAYRERIKHKEYSELVLALAKNGAPVEHFVEQVRSEKEAREFTKKKEKKIIDKLSGLFSKNSTEIGSKRYFRLPDDEVDL